MTDSGSYGAHLIANTVKILVASLKNPGSDSVVTLESSGGPVFPQLLPSAFMRSAISPKKAPPAKRVTRDEPLSSRFKISLVVVIGLTLLSISIELALAFLTNAPATDFQKKLFDAADFGWKAGVGAIGGLLGGKQA